MLMLLNCPPRRILGRFWPVPLPPAGTFDGKTVLIVGGTSGIGLAAAAHFATLGANVIITCRVAASRGEAAEQHIKNKVGSVPKGRISSLVLDMERYDSCTDIVDELKCTLPGPEALDVAILNAGLINSHYERSPEGWEKTIQINTISTTLVGLLLLEWMRGGRGQRSSPAHLIFVTSRDHLYPDVRQFAKWAETKEGVLRQASGYRQQLMSGTMVAKSPDHGYRLCVTVSVKPKENHGEFFNFWLTADQYHKLGVKNVTSDIARNIQKLVWQDVISELTAKVPRLQTELVIS
ncbi:putative short chain dehydrogenase/ reductase [Xylaria sp. FL0064]|nr:putative short chain dehydrogenase/ reductase [Xylaria sp. FL0064]